jgi:hypothetical protein
VGYVIAADGIREGVLADFGFAITQYGCSRSRKSGAVISVVITSKLVISACQFGQ